MRVLIFDRSVANNYSLGLALGLRRAGAEPRIAGPTNFRHPLVVPMYPRAVVAGQKAAKAFEAVLGSRHWFNLLRSWRPDVLHFQWAGRPSYVIAKASKRIVDAPVVHTVHNPVPRGELYQHEMWRLADALIVHGPTLRDALLRHAPIEPSRVHVIPLGNHEHAITRYDRSDARERLGLPAGEPVYAFIGSLQRRKGVDTLVEAFRLHCERGQPGCVVIAGARDDVDVHALRAHLGRHQSRVHWLTDSGQLAAATIDQVVSAATQMVLPFHEASQSSSAILSMTHGRCVVTSSIGELPATVGNNGILVPPGDARAVAAAMELAVTDPEKCDSLGGAARAFALTALDWGPIAAKTINVYEDALRTRAHVPAHEGASS